MNLYAALGLMLLINSCKRNKCDDTRDAYSIYSTSIALDMRDDTNRPLFKENSSLYEERDLKVFDESGDTLHVDFSKTVDPATPGTVFKVVNISGIIKSADIGLSDNCKRIFIMLKADRDTLDYCYSLTNGDCGPVLSKMSLTFNGVSVAGRSDQWGFSGSIKK